MILEGRVRAIPSSYNGTRGASSRLVDRADVARVDTHAPESTARAAAIVTRRVAHCPPCRQAVINYRRVARTLFRRVRFFFYNSFFYNFASAPGAGAGKVASSLAERASSRPACVDLRRTLSL